MAPPGNQAANREHKPRPTALGGTRLLAQALSTDFTELHYAGGDRKAWLIAIHDLVSRWAVSWAVGRRRNRELALECWDRARPRLQRFRGDLRGLIVHQDQDSVFTSYRWLRQLLLEDGVRLSYSPNGARSNPWIESLWGRMKVESRSLILEASSLLELREVIDRRFEYYNEKRRHSSIGYQTPAEFLAAQIENPGEDISPKS